MSYTAPSLRRCAALGALVGWAGLLLWALLAWSSVSALPAQPATARVRLAQPLAAAPVMSVAMSAPVTSTVAFEQAEVIVGEGDGRVVVRLLIDPPAAQAITLTLSTAAIDASAPADYLALRQLDRIAAGVGLLTVTVPLIDDAQVEGLERFRMTLSNVEGAQAGVFTQTNILIIDNDIAYLGIMPVTVDERAGSVTLVITQSISSTLQSLVGYTTVDGSAVAPDDYQAASGTAVIPPGSTATTLTLTVVNDTEVEPPESFTVRLLDPLNATLVQSTTTVAILDDDGLPRLTVENTVADEASGRMIFAVTLETAWPNTVTVAYATAGGTAQVGVDYRPAAGRLLLPAGTTTGTITLQLLQDDLPEADETIVLALSAPEQAQLVQTEAQGILRDATAVHTYLPALMR
jgi:hypothetical protein